VLADIHEQLQHIAYILQAVNTERRDRERLRRPQRYPRPWELNTAQPSGDDAAGGAENE